MKKSTSKLLLPLLIQALLITFPSPTHAINSNLFREYIGAEFKNVTFSDVPINPDVRFHFILAFAIDSVLDNSSSPSTTNGNFSVYWDTANGNFSVYSLHQEQPPKREGGIELRRRQRRKRPCLFQRLLG
uniref:Uncharacterized protein n=1 Tax=Nelumbo nucifera TaxID=4432 RepID=A0A822XWI0_NELNU|nr:TPA_asm: hypothetical protein HUJ06_027462 [Nelumbo nucifera]